MTLSIVCDYSRFPSDISWAVWHGFASFGYSPSFYIADTIIRHIRTYNVRDDWTFSGGDILVELKGEEEGKPVGLKLDVNGNIFSTGPGGIWICTPEGDILGRIKIPEKTSNLAWGDEDYSSLYITASTGLYKIHCLTSGSY